jgi:hypothetical protein
MVMLWGVYFGEVFRRNRGGTWSYLKLDDGRQMLQLQLQDKAIRPLSRVEKQIRSGAEFSVLAFYRWVGGIAGKEGRAAPPSDDLRRFAAQVLEFALTFVPRQGTMNPFLLQGQGDRSKIKSFGEMETFVVTDTGKAIAHGRKRASEQPAEVDFIALVYDGYLGTMGKDKKDAILAETHQRGLPTGFVFGQCYRREPDGTVVKVGEVEDVSRCAAYLGTSS